MEAGLKCSTADEGRVAGGELLGGKCEAIEGERWVALELEACERTIVVLQKH